MRPDSVDRVLEALSGFELRLLGRWNLDLFAGSRIASFRRCPPGNGESTKTNQPYLVSVLEGGGDGIEHTIDGTSRIGPRQSGLGGHDTHEIVFVHGKAPSWDTGPSG